MKQRKIIYENAQLPDDYSPDRYEFRTPAGAEFDPQWAVCHRNGVEFYRMDSGISKSRVQESCGRKYRVNSIFPHTAGRDLDDNIRHRSGRKLIMFPEFLRKMLDFEPDWEYDCLGKIRFPSTLNRFDCTRR